MFCLEFCCSRCMLWFIYSLYVCHRHVKVEYPRGLKELNYDKSSRQHSMWYLKVKVDDTVLVASSGGLENKHKLLICDNLVFPVILQEDQSFAVEMNSH